MAYQSAYVDFDCKSTAYYMGLGLKNTDGSITPVVQNDTTITYVNGQINITTVNINRIKLELRG